MMHSLRMGFFIVGGVYFCGILWFELVNFYIYQPDEVNFVSTYFQDRMDSIDKQILTGYFALTSLCTCGLGDIVPISNSE